MQYFKLQAGCMIIVLYVTFIYIRERYAYKVKRNELLFKLLLGMAIFGIFFDGATAYTVNHIEQVGSVINTIFHAFFLCSLDAMVFLIFLYILEITGKLPKLVKYRIAIAIPFIINIIVVLVFMPKLEYRYGEITYYSMGISAYTCFIMVAVYMLGAVIMLIAGWRKVEHHKFITISTCIGAAVVTCIYQMLNPQALITSLVPVLVIIGAYLNMENPLFVKLKEHNNEMVMGFATLVENRDGSTGGHIRRTTTYVELLAKELRDRGVYKEELTEDYINNLVMAAPMHDVGKIAIPDAILQKPGKLTDEEYTLMKTHAQKGGEIIRETFGNNGEDEYEKIAYEVARYHHEKWNGKGYPEGLLKDNIPLSARIMAVADVFDAVSAKRCYRDALPLEVCFNIIKDGIGEDFDPYIAKVFIDMQGTIAKVVNGN